MHTTTPLCFVLSAIAIGCTTSPDELGPGSASRSTIYAAIEDDGSLAELNGTTGALVRTIDLSQQAHGGTVKFDVHNAQGAPDGRMIWLTAMPESEGGHASGEPMPEQLIGVDTTTSQVSERIVLGEELHAAHVVVANERAYVTAYDADAVLVVDLAAKRGGPYDRAP